MSLIQPALNDTPFAKNGQKNTIPKTTSTKGKASLDQGFPPETMVDKLSGGIAPSGKDMNGILALLSEHQIWLNAGGMYKFNGELANAIGGYAKGALVLSDNENEVYFSTVSNNGNNPNVNLTGWKYLSTYDDVEYLATQIQSLLNNKYDKSGGQISGNVSITGTATIENDLIAKHKFSLITPPTVSNTNADWTDISHGNGTVYFDTSVLRYMFNKPIFAGNYAPSPNGWTTLPNGFILQWGEQDYSSQPGEINVTVNFPTAFPNACFNVSPTRKAIASTTNADGGIYLVSKNNSSAQLLLQNYNSDSVDGLRGFSWIAIGR